MIDKSKHDDATFSREDFTFDKECNVYVCSSVRSIMVFAAPTSAWRIARDARPIKKCPGGQSPHYDGQVGQ